MLFVRMQGQKFVCYKMQDMDVYVDFNETRNISRRLALYHQSSCYIISSYAVVLMLHFVLAIRMPVYGFWPEAGNDRPIHSHSPRCCLWFYLPQ